MTLYSTYYLDLLKRDLLIAAGCPHITAADCKLIAIRITEKTKQRISETTLKRIYGFALSSFKPSLFTLDVLSKYSGYDNWAHFCLKHDPLNSNIPDTAVNWHAIQQKADKITNFTITALKNRSGIPYNQTIKRLFIDQHFESYLSSGCIGTVFSAHAGYGKTIALCHWVEEKMAQNMACGNKDIILFFSSNALMSVLLSGRDINDWMLALLGYSNEGDLSTLLDKTQRSDGNFYLIVDGFDEYKFKNERFNITLSQLIDILALHSGNKWLKVILTMRPSTWINYRHELESVDNIWYTGFKKNSSSFSNIPLFNAEEIKQLCLKINPSAPDFTVDNIVEDFNHPLYFQFYYKQHKGEFSFNNIDHIVIYELISAFIYNQVYAARNSAEKVLLINLLIAEMDIKSQVYYVDKLKINHQIKQYGQAYQDMLSSGIIKELNVSNDYQYRAYTEFGNLHFLGHSIAIGLLNANNGLFDRTLIDKFNELLASNPHKLQVLKWCIMHDVKNNRWENFECLTEAILCANEKADLVVFLSDLLEKETGILKETDPFIKHFSYSLTPKMFNYFFGLELISPYYQKTLNTLLKFELSAKKKILIYTGLGIIAYIRLDLDELYACLSILKNFPKECYQSFIINPLTCLDTIYYFLKFGIVKKEAFAQLTKLCFYFPEDTEQNNAATDMLCLLGLYTLLLSDNPKKTIRTVNVFKSKYKLNQAKLQNSNYNFFLQVMLADAYFKLGDHNKVSGLYFVISSVYKTEEFLTPYMKSLFIALKIKTLLNTPDEKYVFNELKCLNVMAEEAGNNLSRLYICYLILTQDEYLTAHPEFQKQLNYDLAKIIRENGLSANAFKIVNSNITVPDMISNKAG